MSQRMERTNSIVGTMAGPGGEKTACKLGFSFPLLFYPLHSLIIHQLSGMADPGGQMMRLMNFCLSVFEDQLLDFLTRGDDESTA